MSERIAQSDHLAASTDGLPEVVLEVRPGAGRSATYTVSHVDFLVGTVPGCDLRVPGSDLPAVLCLLARRPGGLSLRKLAPTQAILINGNSSPQTELNDGDRITVGVLDIFVRVSAATVAASAVRPAIGKTSSASAAGDAELKKRSAHLDEMRRLLVERERDLQNQAEEIDRERAAWLVQRDEMRKQMVQEKKAKESLPPPLLRKEEELSRREIELGEHQADVDRQRQELAGVRQELADIRKDLYDRYQERRDRLSGLQEAVDRAARKVQERKRAIDNEEQQLEQRRLEEARRHAELERRGTDLAKAAQRLEEDRRTFQESQGRIHRDLSEKLADLQSREQKLVADRLELEGKGKQYQADILRLDRQQGSLEERERVLAANTEASDRRHAELQQSSADLEQQVLELDQWRTRLTEEQEALNREKAEHRELDNQLAQRAASIEGQQAALAALRTRLERQREDLRRQEQQLEEQRLREEERGTELEARMQEAMKLRAELDADRSVRERERQDISQRQAVLDAAVNQLRQAQDKLTVEETSCQARKQELERRLAEVAEQDNVLKGRLAQLVETQERLDSERQSLRERTQDLALAEQARAALQEQLRRRGEELAARQKELHEQVQKHEVAASDLKARQEEWSHYQQESCDQLEARKQELDTQATQLDRQRCELLQRDEAQRRRAEELKESGQHVAAERQELVQDRDNYQAEQQKIWKARDEAREEYVVLRRQAEEFMEKLPEIDLRAGNTLDRMVQAREQLRDHLSEIHAYVRQCQEDLEGVHHRLQDESQTVDDKDKILRQHQDEHRLALASFRQHLIDWQGQVVEMKRAIAQGEVRLERRQAKVEEQARRMDQTHQQLTRQAEELEQQQRLVAGRRQEMDRHLTDMREWYRQKLRELVGADIEAASSAEPATNRAGSISDGPTPIQAAAGEEEETPFIPIRRDILSLTDPVDPGDRQLGDVLRTMELVDADTLQALLVETRRQRRSLRQVLLASGTITLYQMALIEAGNVDGLMLGPVRVIDRIRVSPQEAVYQVFDPRRGHEAVLRHLAEEEMRDPVRADEYRRHFDQARLEHPNLARTLEVLTIAGRPAVLQEWLSGLPSTDWPPLVAVPGVCWRLLNQAALALAAAHGAGLVHAHLHENLLLLLADGTLKICGWGEPAWLSEPGSQGEGSAKSDLLALGRIVSTWCTPTGVRRGPKAKPLPENLMSVLQRLSGERDSGYASAGQLLDDLGRIQADISANAEAWDRLLRHVREHATPEAILRKTA